MGPADLNTNPTHDADTPQDIPQAAPEITTNEAKETPESPESESESDEDWVYEEGKAMGVKEGRPPLINLDALSKPTSKVFESRDDKLDQAFEDANHWTGISMTIEEFRSFIWSPQLEKESDTSILNAHKFDKGRRKCIKFKVEKHLRIHRLQIENIEYYITTKGGLIAWIKLDPRMIGEIQRRASKAALKDFCTVHYVPKLARDRKLKIDELLMSYKKTNPNFRYLVRNDKRDLKVLIKRTSEGNFVPYRRMSLEVLGRILPLKTQIPEKERNDEPEIELNDFQKQGRKRTQSFIPKEAIFRNINAILNGFELQDKKNDQ